MESKNLNLEYKTKLNPEMRQELNQKRHGPILRDSIQVLTGTSQCNLKLKEITRNRSFHQLYYTSFNANDLNTSNTNNNNDNNDNDDDDDNDNDDDDNDIEGNVDLNAIEETVLKSNEIDLDGSSSLASLTAKLQSKLSKYRNELREYNNTTKDLEDKYIKMTLELNEMQQKHNQFVAINHNCSNSIISDIATMDDVTSADSQYSLKRKNTPIFDRANSILRIALKESNGNPLTISKRHPNKFDEDSSLCNDSRIGKPNSINNFCVNKYTCQHHSKHHTISEDKENEILDDDLTNDDSSLCDINLRNCYRNTKSIQENRNPNKSNINGNDQHHQHYQQHQQQQQLKDINRLQTAIVNLQNEKQKYRNVIKRQQSCLADYYSRCVKAHEVMHAQRIEIDKLHTNNHELEQEITSGIERLRHKLEMKLRELAQLPQMLHDEQFKHARARKENAILHERIRATQTEMQQLKEKLEEVNKKKFSIVTKLKVAERDLKVFKNYNAALKQEKQRLNNELQKLREQMDTIQNGNKRILNRQHEQSEKHRRELQKRVFELELKLNRSQKSTSSLLQERDNIITELQSQLNTLVHNFEVSQKHIRLLRRHIYAMSNDNNGHNGGISCGNGNANSSSYGCGNNAYTNGHGVYSTNNYYNNRGPQQQQQQKQQQQQQQQHKQYQMYGNNRVHRSFPQGT